MQDKLRALQEMTREEFKRLTNSLLWFNGNGHLMAEKRQTSTTEFKHEAVRLVTAHGDGVAEAARTLGINATMLGRWQCEQEARAGRAFPGKGRLAPDQEELHRLREEHKRLRMEREILTKAAALFANELS